MSRHCPAKRARAALMFTQGSIFEPRAIYAVAIRLLLAFPEDLDGYAARKAQRAGFIYGHSDLLDAGVGQTDARDFLGQAFDELKTDSSTILITCFLMVL